MSQAEKRLEAIRNNPKNVDFDELCWAATRSGFVLERTSGSHRIFRHPDDPEEMLDLQPGRDGKAKPYQVKDFLEALDRLFPEQHP
jgi:predicted RNA binding protein YcfA (HicA-like mRNA interferase family)